MKLLYHVYMSKHTGVTFRVDRLQALIDRRGKSLGQVAKFSHVSKSQLSLLLKGERPNVSAVIVGKLATYFEVSTDYLVGLTDDPSPRAENQLPPRVRRMWDLFIQLSPLNRLMIVQMCESLAAVQSASDGPSERLVRAVMAEVEYYGAETFNAFASEMIAGDDDEHFVTWADLDGA